MKRVVVTGIGVVSPIGNTVNEYYDNMINGMCGINKIRSFDTEGCAAKLAAEVNDPDYEKYFKPRKLRYDARFTKFARYASLAAKDDAFGDRFDADPFRVGVILSSTAGGSEQTSKNGELLSQQGFSYIEPSYIPSCLSNMAGANVAIDIGAKGYCACVNTACASGTNSIGEAYKRIVYDELDVVFAGASEASITPLTVGAFAAMRVLYEGDNINRASIPFDAERGGFVMGEGAAVLVLESLEHALKRNAKIYCEIVGYSANCDAYSLTAPQIDNVERLFVDLLKQSGVTSKQIDYINAHGTSTVMNDKTEAAVINKVFSHAPFVSSTKSATGHLLGAAGAIEAVSTVLAVHRGFVPPNVNYSNEDPECLLNIPIVATETSIEYAISDSLGFGGHNAALIFKKYKN